MKDMRRMAAALACTLVLAGCGGVPQSAYNAVCADRDALSEELSEIQSSGAEKVQVRISGQFSAMVRELLPDYVGDDFTPRVAVVTEFQAAPFTLALGDRAAELEIGEVYVFEIEPKEVELTRGVSYEYAPVAAVPLYGLKSSGFRAADTENSGEWGLQPKGIEFEEIR